MSQPFPFFRRRISRATGFCLIQTARIYVTGSPIGFVRFPLRFSTRTVDEVIHDSLAKPFRMAFTQFAQEKEHVRFDKIGL
jgi:hypothetical protein